MFFEVNVMYSFASDPGRCPKATTRATSVVFLCFFLVMLVAQCCCANNVDGGNSRREEENTDDADLTIVSPDATLTSAPENSPSLPLPALVEHLTNETYDAYVRNTSFISVVFFYATWHSHSVRILEVVEKLAEYFQAEDNALSTEQQQPRASSNVALRFAALHGPHYRNLCRKLRVDAFPELRVFVRGIKKPHVFTGHVYSFTELLNFVQRIVKTDRRQAMDEAAHKARVAATPQKIWNPTPGRVLELEPEELPKYRNSTNILLFVLFYAPWCHSCHGPVGALNGVAEYFTNDRTVVIAKINCDRFSIFCVEEMNIEGYPTIITYHKPRMSKEGTKYEGHGYDTIDMTQYLDIQNQFFDHEGLDEVRAQFEKVRHMKREDLPEDISELGGIFAHFSTKKHQAPQANRDKLGKKARSPHHR